MDPRAELEKLTGLFPDGPPMIESAEHVPGSTVPEPYKSLLVHDSHMTVSMERHHDCTVDVRILALRDVDEQNVYAREIVLTKRGTEHVVQFGIVRFDFDYVTEAVREEIVAGEIPLGRVLINHNVLRHVDLGAVLRFRCGPGLADLFRCEQGTETYGRLATIFCNGQPAVDLLEISTPLQ